MQTNDNTVDNTVNKTRKTQILPSKQADMLTLAEAVLNKWSTTPEITLLWINLESFTKLVQEFKTKLQQRFKVGSTRKSRTQLLKKLDRDLEKAVGELKIAILSKFGKTDGRAYYSEFGIVKSRSKYEIPRDRDQRQQALISLIEGVEKHQLSINGYDLAFFQEVQNQYNELLLEAKNIDSSVSQEVSHKNELIKQVSKVLNALIYIIKGNYPDTYKAELRNWGFQKEKY